MTRPQTRQRPTAIGRGCRKSLEYGNPTTPRLPHNWRYRLSDPATYYAAHVDKLGKPTAEGWAECLCPFHADRNASASVNLLTGGFRCHGCGAHHDLIGFHQRVTGLDFTAAVRELIGVRL